MALEWYDVCEVMPGDGTEVWIRSTFGCVPPVKAVYFILSTTWTVELPDGGTIAVSYWDARYWRLLV